MRGVETPVSFQVVGFKSAGVMVIGQLAMKAQLEPKVIKNCLKMLLLVSCGDRWDELNKCH
jgi:hypothetical protein